MKKLYLLTFVFSLFVIGLFAQDNSPKKFKVITGVNLGSQYIDVPQFKGNSAFTTSLHIAAFVDLSIFNNFFIQPGLSFSGKGAKYDYAGTGVDPTFGAYNFTYKGTSSVMYLEIPINGIYKIKNIYIGAGPYFGYALSGKKDINTIASNELGALNERDNGNIKFGNEQDDDFRKTDYGANFLIGYQFEDGFNVGANFGLGLYNLSPVNNQEAKNRVISISLGYAF
ncbi:porin family protein [Pedobacter alpinus]|uniref:Porin family protein n=1 Tax=Pedobacter alpinus TaxID=1590643 RepID=A0ABW5TNY8_9SPHI